MNKSELLKAILDNVRKKHPWFISQQKYLDFFGELPREFIDERIHLDNLMERHKSFHLCRIGTEQVKVEIRLTLDQCCRWEIARWEDAAGHNILPGDIKKLLKDQE